MPFSRPWLQAIYAAGNPGLNDLELSSQRICRLCYRTSWHRIWSLQFTAINLANWLGRFCQLVLSHCLGSGSISWIKFVSTDYKMAFHWPGWNQAARYINVIACIDWTGLIQQRHIERRPASLWSRHGLCTANRWSLLFLVHINSIWSGQRQVVHRYNESSQQLTSPICRLPA